MFRLRENEGATMGRSMRTTEDRGATAVEYALLLAGIAGAVIVTVTLLGPTVLGLFTITW